MNVQCHTCIGGTSVGEDIHKLKYGQHFVFGTLGRVSDVIRRWSLRMRNIKMLVLDKVDDLLNKGPAHRARQGKTRCDSPLRVLAVRVNGAELSHLHQPTEGSDHLCRDPGAAETKAPLGIIFPRMCILPSRLEGTDT